MRVALQFAVSRSGLRLPAGSKAGLRGFATVRPAPLTADGHRAPCELWLRYEIAGEVRTLCVEDAAPVLLGRASAARGAR